MLITAATAPTIPIDPIIRAHVLAVLSICFS